MNIMDVNLNKIVTNSKSFEELTESEKMLLALKGALVNSLPVITLLSLKLILLFYL